MAYFRIYYGDGTTFEGEPEDAPTECIVCIVTPPIKVTSKSEYHRHRLVREADMYVYSDVVGGWFPCDKYEDLKRHLKLSGMGKGGIRAVIDGMWINRERYLEICHQAQRDHNMPERD